MVYKIFKLGQTYKTIFYKTHGGSSKDDFGLDQLVEPQNDKKLDNNLSRAKSRVKELALCNEWSHFFTLTLDDKKHDRYDLDSFVKKLGKWIEHYNRKFGTKLKYLLIPEQHKDGAWHMHGLMNGLFPDSLVKNKYGYLDMPFYSDRFGYISIDPVKSAVGVAKYICKYITKATQTTEIKVNKHLFYSSHGLKGKELVHEDFTDHIPDGVWTNDFIGVKDFDTYEDLAKFIKSMQGEEEKIESINSDSRISAGTSNARSQPCNNRILPSKPRLVQRIFRQPRYLNYNPVKRTRIRLKA